MAPDADRTDHDHAFLDNRPLAYPDIVAKANPGYLDLDLPGQGIEVALLVFLHTADVVPVVLMKVPVEVDPLVQEPREEVPPEIVELSLGDHLQHLRLEDINTAVGDVAPRLLRAWLLLETADQAVFFRDHHPVFGWIIDGSYNHGGDSAMSLVEFHEFGEVEIREGIAADDKEGITSELLSQPFHPPRRPHQLFLVGVGDGNAPV